MAVVLNPLVKWAQDRSLLYLTVELSNAVVNELEIGEKSLKFQGCGQGAQGENLYKLDITFHGDVDPKVSTVRVAGLRSVLHATFSAQPKPRGQKQSAY